MDKKKANLYLLLQNVSGLFLSCYLWNNASRQFVQSNHLLLHELRNPMIKSYTVHQHATNYQAQKRNNCVFLSMLPLLIETFLHPVLQELFLPTPIEPLNNIVSDSPQLMIFPLQIQVILSNLGLHIKYSRIQ